uniref:Uncharacterized protein n=1 Tax=Oryza barthii TaxID=65489 RepID=A0A0D3GP92_9ORYZ
MGTAHGKVVKPPCVRYRVMAHGSVDLIIMSIAQPTRYVCSRTLQILVVQVEEERHLPHLSPLLLKKLKSYDFVPLLGLHTSKHWEVGRWSS